MLGRISAARLIQENTHPPFMLLDILPQTFAEHGYFNIVIDYTKQDRVDFLCEVTATNRGPDPALA